MAEENVEVGEQMDLLDVQPENAKAIMAAAKLYKKHQIARQAALAKEITQKEKLLELVRAAKLKPLADGVIKFACGGMIISVTPRDELIKVKEPKDDTLE